jgi:tetratricopeptide (TPR) repeat protein
LRQLANKEIRNTLDIEVNPRADRWSFSSALKKKKQRTLYLWNELVEAHIRCHSGSRLGCDLGEPTLASGNLDDIPNDFTLRALYLALLARSHSLSHPAYRQILQQGLAYLETTPAASETLSQAVIADIYLNAAEFYEHMYDYENANRYFQTAAGWMERSGAFSQPRIGSALISAGIALIRLEGIRLNPTPQDNLRNEEVSLLEKGWKYFEDVEALGDVNLNYYQTGVNVALYYMDIGAYEQSRHVLESLKQAATKRNESKGNIEGALCAIQIHLGQSILAQKDIDHFRDTARLEKKTRQISHQIETVAPTTTKGCFVFGLPKPQHPALALIEEVEDDIGATQRFFDTLIDVLIRIESYEAAQIHVEEKKRVYREIETISFKGFRNGIRHFTVDWAELYYQQGRIALKTGDFDTSLVYFQKAQKEYDTDAKWSTNEIAMLVYRQIANELKGNTAQAKILFRRAIAALKPSGKQNTWIDVPRLGSIAHLYAAYGRCEKVETLNNMRLSLCSDNTGCERLKREAELQLRECEVLRHRIDNSHHRITEAPPVR